MSHRKVGQEGAHVIPAELTGRSAANESLELSHPKAVGCQGFAGVVPEFDGPFRPSRSGSTYGSPGAGALGLRPAPGAAHRLPRFLWQPLASERFVADTARLRASWVTIGQVLGPRQAGNSSRLGFTGTGQRSKKGLDEWEPSSVEQEGGVWITPQNGMLSRSV
jgi:hypothetical protein